MGGWQSTTRGTEEPEDQSTCSQYRYPPKVGNYFSTHFIMGGEKFDSPQPESFLFGDNSDLNFLGSKPVPFPYPPPQANEPTKTLKALINIRRDSLHFVKVKNAEGEDEVGKYNIVFTLDSDVRSNITIFYLASEEVGPQSVVYTPKQDTMCSPTYIYRKGSGQMFSQPDHIFQVDNFYLPGRSFLFTRQIIFIFQVDHFHFPGRLLSFSRYDLQFLTSKYAT
ncbi:E3 ubiquitin-protein ligase MGRN1 [Eurytemora carolleeae]|uniref:E3 ubiquitin-protein ligase MGRN1 n=1 Tax=Eurytemora carolleeae TaxID=1294199 RepID=UPI000C76BF5B|nr:E3 ubiquitin-protein ligase MGRN1 [Eurytemora carolleeae]|eukprot:XP_023324209.1 E3 ubiquitin-protein ligase MGRN1-like [Eurytemora affinis]